VRLTPTFGLRCGRRLLAAKWCRPQPLRRRSFKRFCSPPMPP